MPRLRVPDCGGATAQSARRTTAPCSCSAGSCSLSSADAATALSARACQSTLLRSPACRRPDAVPTVVPKRTSAKRLGHRWPYLRHLAFASAWVCFQPCGAFNQRRKAPLEHRISGRRTYRIDHLVPHRDVHGLRSQERAASQRCSSNLIHEFGDRARRVARITMRCASASTRAAASDVNRVMSIQ